MYKGKPGDGAGRLPPEPAAVEHAWWLPPPWLQWPCQLLALLDVLRPRLEQKSVSNRILALQGHWGNYCATLDAGSTMLHDAGPEKIITSFCCRGDSTSCKQGGWSSTGFESISSAKI